jgi:glycosyltransferase involved in cell wall biosynthesis
VVNGYAPLERSEPVGGEQARNLRLVTLCGSIKPLFSGTDDFHENLVEVLRRKQVDARPVDLKQWGLAQVPELLRRVAAERPDAILMQYPTDAFSAALGPHAFSALQRQAPLVVTLHEFAAANPIRRASVGVLLARCAAVIATAETERRSLVAWFPWLKARSCVIPIGANFPGREWRPSEPPIVVYFGQIRPEKGLEEFIACKDVLATRFPSAKFVVAGSRVPKFASYYQTIEIEARNRGIDVLGEMAPERVPDFLRTATVAMLPYPSGASFRRGSLLAAVACGVPIVTLRGSETPPEIIGLLEPASTRDELVAQAAACLSDRAKRDAAHDRSRQLAALVSWDGIGNRYVEVLRGLIKRRLSL